MADELRPPKFNGSVTDEAAAIATGYRPCGHCLRPRYKTWKEGGEPGTESFPWLTVQRVKSS